MVANRGENVEQLALGRGGVGHTIGGHQRDAQPARALYNRLVVRLFFAVIVALELGVDVVFAENAKQPFIRLARETDQPLGKLGQFFQSGCAFAFLSTQLHAGDEAAQVAIALACLRQQRIAHAVNAGDFRADVRAEAGLLRRHVKARGAIDAVAVHQRHRRHAELGAGPDELLGNGSAFEKTEAGAGVELDVALSHSCPRRTSRAGRNKCGTARRRSRRCPTRRAPRDRSSTSRPRYATARPVRARGRERLRLRQSSAVRKRWRRGPRVAALICARTSVPARGADDRSSLSRVVRMRSYGTLPAGGCRAVPESRPSLPRPLPGCAPASAPA